MKFKVKIISIILLILCVTPQMVAQDVTRSHIIAAREYLSSGDNNLARLELDSALHISPTNAMANAMMGDYYFELGRYARAILYYDNAVLMASSDAQLFMQRAETHRLLKNHRVYVLQDYNKAISIEPENVAFYLEKANYLASSINPDTYKLDFEAAASVMTEAIAINKSEPELYFLRSNYLMGAEQFLSALTDINKAISLSPSNDEYFAERGQLNFTMGRYTSANTDFSRAIELNPKEFKYYESKGHSNFNLGNYPEAYDDYSTTIDMIIAEITYQQGSIEPNNSINKSLRLALLYRGMSLVQDNRPYDGCDDFKRAYKMGESKARNYLRKYCY